MEQRVIIIGGQNLSGGRLASIIAALERLTPAHDIDSPAITEQLSALERLSQEVTPMNIMPECFRTETARVSDPCPTYAAVETPRPRARRPRQAPNSYG